MKIIKNSSKDDTFHSNSCGKVNTIFACFVIDLLSMLLLFDAYVDHNANASPNPWAGRNLSTIKEDRHDNKLEQEMLQKNQTILIKFCLSQREDIAWKFFGNKKTGQLGWQVGELALLWTASVRYFSKFNLDNSSSYKDCQVTDKGIRGKIQCGFTTLSSSNCATQSFIKSKALCFIMTIVSCLFIASPIKRSKNTLISIISFQGLI